MYTRITQETIPSLELTALTQDSRSVIPGSLFAAFQGTCVEGREFLGSALKAGAKALLVAPEDVPFLPHTEAPVALLVDEVPRRLFAHLASAHCPHQPTHSVAITGTNGKTSTAELTRQLWTLGGLRASSLGTLGLTTSYGTSVHTSPSGGLTTPDTITLHTLLSQLAHDHYDHLAMEASSQGLQRYRLDGVHLEAAAFTNLTLDHLDTHGTFSAYREAKFRLFHEVLPPNAPVVVNREVPEYELLSHVPCLISYGFEKGDLHCLTRRPQEEGQEVTLKVMDDTFSVSFPFRESIQLSNALCALGLVIATGGDPKTYVPLLEGLKPIEGRLQKVGLLRGSDLYVDFAHTPDALRHALQALRERHQAVTLVFGCGGDRDVSKRPLMGAMAAGFATHIVVTSDNPRHEPPLQICRSVLEGCPEAVCIVDRREAIAYALQNLKSGEALLVAGRGSETHQLVEGKKLPFKDADVVRSLMRELEA